MQKGGRKRALRPPQKQRRPGTEAQMRPKPEVENPALRGSGLLLGKVALITGGDSGIGRAVAVAFAREGADVAIAYLSEHKDARATKELVETHGQRCLLLAGDLGREAQCKRVVERTYRTFGRLDVLVNNAAAQYPQEHFEDIDRAQVERTFRSNILSFFSVTRAALRYMKESSSIINTTSVTAYRGSAHLVDYSATKGAIVSFTRSLSSSLIKRGIRVNAVAPGPVWTPLIPSTFTKKQVAAFGSDAPMGRAGEPDEIAPCYVFLASAGATYMTGQVLHPNGGEIVNG
jgi:NAD(P)-dependent dehydrogenase (short-subunit alcohol dehydrogenase family)